MQSISKALLKVGDIFKEITTYLEIDDTVDWIHVAEREQSILQIEGVASGFTHWGKHNMLIVAVGADSDDLVVDDRDSWILKNDAELVENVGRWWCCWEGTRKGAADEASCGKSLKDRCANHDCNDIVVNAGTKRRRVMLMARKKSMEGSTADTYTRILVAAHEC